jgi:hypothetical protein
MLSGDSLRAMPTTDRSPACSKTKLTRLFMNVVFQNEIWSPKCDASKLNLPLLASEGNWTGLSCMDILRERNHDREKQTKGALMVGLELAKSGPVVDFASK